MRLAKGKGYGVNGVNGVDGGGGGGGSGGGGGGVICTILVLDVVLGEEIRRDSKGKAMLYKLWERKSLT